MRCVLKSTELNWFKWLSRFDKQAWSLMFGVKRANAVVLFASLIVLYSPFAVQVLTNFFRQM